MAVDFHPVTSSFVAEVGDVDVSRPFDEGDLSAIMQAFSVLIFPDQRLSVGQHLAFARHFGPLEDDCSASPWNATARAGRNRRRFSRDQRELAANNS